VPLGEFAFIDRLLKPLATGAGALGLVDDAALIDPPPGCQLVLTKDAMVAGVHFLEDDPPAAIAQKLLRVNLSDLAAMGATPLGYLLALARSRAIDDAWLEGFCQGLAADQARYGITLLGGDTVGTPGPLTLSLTAIGTVSRGRALLRRAARAGDRLWVSGTLGDAALGLRVLQGTLHPGAAAAEVLIGRYRLPEPRLGLGRRLFGLAHAAIDVSDGLLADLRHILDASGIGAVVEAARLPLPEAAQGLDGALDAALAGGDDYELLFTAPEAATAALEALGRELDLRLTPIGHAREEPGLVVLGPDGRELPQERGGWTHF
jgi:thiamine-monophosphate kinase